MNRVFQKAIRLASLIVCLGAAVFLINDMLIQPQKLDNAQKKAQQLYGQNRESAEPDLIKRFAALRKINPDIEGWIKIPNTNIDLPVLQASSSAPEFYLNHDYQKAPSKYGSIFADANSQMLQGDVKSIILYGHTLRNEKMFSELKKYKDLNFLKENPVVDFATMQKDSKWKIISVLITNTLESQGPVFHYMQTTFYDGSDYLNFVYQLRIRSMYNTGVSFRADDKILLLSTCSYEFDGFRLVVAARKIRAGENASVNPKQISVNSKALYPDCWYRRYGTQKPSWPESYEAAKDILSGEED